MKTSINGKKSGINLKLLLAPVLFAVAFRYIPHYFYGNTKVYKEPIPYRMMDNFLSEETILDLREWIKTEKRFATAVEAAFHGVTSIGNILKKKLIS